VTHTLHYTLALAKYVEASTTITARNRPHLPFRFILPRFEPGTVEVVGFIGGKAVATQRARTLAGCRGQIFAVKNRCGFLAAEAGIASIFCYGLAAGTESFQQSGGDAVRHPFLPARRLWTSD